MTAAKPNHLKARRLLLDHLDLHPGKTVNADLDPLEAGIVGDTAHAEGGDSYHLGKDKIRARAGRSRYSVDESGRDSRGLDNYASAMDIGYFRVTTGKGTFDLYDFNAWLIELCRSGDPDTRDLREVIFSLDGKTVRRWDRLGRRSTGDSSHLTHTHLSEHRDADGHRMVRLATRWLQHIGLIQEEDDVTPAELRAAVKAELTAALDDIAKAVGDRKVNVAPGAPTPNLQPWISVDGYGSMERHRILTAVTALTARLNTVAVQVGELSGRDLTDEPAIVAGVLAGLDPQAIAAAIPAEVAEQVAQKLAERLAA